MVKDGGKRFKTLLYVAFCLTVFYVHLGSSKEGGAGAVDEDDFIKAFTDVPTVQVRGCVYSCLSSEIFIYNNGLTCFFNLHNFTLF